MAGRGRGSAGQRRRAAHRRPVPGGRAGLGARRLRRELQAALAGFGRIGALLAEPRTLPDPDPDPDPDPADPRPLPAPGPLRLELSQIDFRYGDDDRPVLHGIDLVLAPGERLGLVGRTGSGKTSVARLILRLYDPIGGSIRIGGVDLRDVDPASLRRWVAMVAQDVQLFAASVRDNLTLFRDGVPDERLRAVLAEAGPNLRLDDLVVVSHRRAALERADTVVVLDRGRVVARGRLAELLRESPEMRRLWSDG